MRLLDAFRAVIVPYPTTPDWTGAPTAGLIQTYMQDGPADRTEKIGQDFESFATLGYAGNGPVFAILNARLRLFTEAVFKYRTLADKKLIGNTSLLLLEKPWPNGGSAELLGRMIQDADLAGNAFVRRVNATRLMRMRPDWVRILTAEVDDGTARDTTVRQVIGYAFCQGGWVSGNDPVFYPVEEVAHWSPVPDPLADWRGMSWLTPVIREINADIAMFAHQQKFFENAATPNMVIRYSGQVKPEQLRTLSEQIQERHAGPENAYKTLLLDEGADVTVVGAAFHDMAFTALQQAGEARLASAGGVPPIVAGLQAGLDASTMANYASAYRNFADSTVFPLWRSACQVLEKFSVPPVGSQLWFDISDIPALRDAEELRQKGYAQMSIAVMNLVNAGYDPVSVIDAVVSGDMTLLKHSGLVSVQLLPAGQAPATSQPGN